MLSSFCLFFLNKQNKSNWIFIKLFQSILFPNLIKSQDCHSFFVKSSKKINKAKCDALIPGIISAIVVVLIVTLGFLFLAFFLNKRRRRQSAIVKHVPIIPSSINDTSQISPTHLNPNKRSNSIQFNQVKLKDTNDKDALEN
ncbi:hypothetical protein O181_015424 [Austropuccinia psidii MF-1]|uniref:Uncharacterized protein n=1 Tax=Austropuccinia psidii MF-1 TaxID=1389203 RepID=A0A9Q3BZX8_9BASI|nr:hypothetical protein [Austropuccinia psidii MF-1]